MSTVHAPAPRVQSNPRDSWPAWTDRPAAGVAAALLMTVGGVTYALERLPRRPYTTERGWRLVPDGFDAARDGWPPEVVRCVGHTRCTCGEPACDHLAGLVALGLVLPNRPAASEGGA